MADAGLMDDDNLDEWFDSRAAQGLARRPRRRARGDPRARPDRGPAQRPLGPLRRRQEPAGIYVWTSRARALKWATDMARLVGGAALARNDVWRVDLTGLQAVTTSTRSWASRARST
jgi:hypothetical protein